MKAWRRAGAVEERARMTHGIELFGMEAIFIR
jgi:hypothetical protein